MLDLVRPMVTDTQFFDELRRAGDVTDDRALRAVPLRVVERPGPEPALSSEHFRHCHRQPAARLPVGVQP